MVAAANKENLKEVFQGYQSVPEPFIGMSGFRTEVWSTSGSWQTPGFQEDYQPNYYTDDKSHNFVLNFTEIAEEVGWDEFVTYSEGSKYISPSKDKNKAVKKSWVDAEAYCKEEGSRLAFIRTGREQKEVVMFNAL